MGIPLNIVAQAALAAAQNAGWVVLKLPADLSVVGVATTLSALSFTPIPNADYEVEAKLYVRTTDVTSGPRPGLVWPMEGIAKNAAVMTSPSSGIGQAFRFWGAPAAANAASTGAQLANEETLATMQGIFRTNGTVNGEFGITMSGELAGATHTLGAGSILRYRIIP